MTLLWLTGQVEPAWGQREMLQFMALQVLSVGLSMFVLILITYGLFGFERILYALANRTAGREEAIWWGEVISLTLCDADWGTAAR